MAFETVYKVPHSLLKGNKGDYYLRTEDLENLAEQSLFYFLKQSKYHILDDYPCMGDFERRFRSSTVEGPFESIPFINPNIEKQNAYSEDTLEVLKWLVPKDLTPVDLEKVSLVKYGTRTDSDTLNHLGLVAGEGINLDHIKEIGEKVLETLRQKCDLQHLSQSKTYRASAKDYLLEFSLGQYHYDPAIKITLFGRGEMPYQILWESGIQELEKLFSGNRDVGIKDSKRNGFAYNLNLQGKEISEIIDSENVLF